MQRKIKIARGVAKSLYPLNWDPNCSDQAFNNWQEYIHMELGNFPERKAMDHTLENFKKLLHDTKN